MWFYVFYCQRYDIMNGPFYLLFTEYIPHTFTVIFQDHVSPLFIPPDDNPAECWRLSVFSCSGRCASLRSGLTRPPLQTRDNLTTDQTGVETSGPQMVVTSRPPRVVTSCTLTLTRAPRPQWQRTLSNVSAGPWGGVWTAVTSGPVQGKTGEVSTYYRDLMRETFIL